MTQYQFADISATSGVLDSVETHYLFQHWQTAGWSRGFFCENLALALQEQLDFYALREGTPAHALPTRILQVQVSTSYKCLKTDF